MLSSPQPLIHFTSCALPFSEPMATLHDVAREISKVRGLATFYEEVLGFERFPSPTYSGVQVAWQPWLLLPRRLRAPPDQLPRRHHLAFSVMDYDGFVTGLKTRGTDVFERTQPDGRTRQVFFFDPDGDANRSRKPTTTTSSHSCDRNPTGAT